jgi:hypothetical protein
MAEKHSNVYHRVETSTQTADIARLQRKTNEIWGKTARYSNNPSVKAYIGPLPDGANGIEFTTDIPPDPDQPPSIVEWTGPRKGVIVDGDIAKIKVVVTKIRPE